MSEYQEAIQEYYESLEYEENTPLLCKYIDEFLRNNKKNEIEQDDKVLLYRGQGSKYFDLRPSVFRRSILGKETKIIEELILQSPDDFSHISNPFERLIKMQHYGLPTRLIDITFNPLVALYFACQKEIDNDFKEIDGEIIVIREYLEPHDSEDVIGLASLSEYNGSSERLFFNYTHSKGLTKTLDELSEIDKDHVSEILKHRYIPASSPRNNERIKRQQGAFLLFGMDFDNQINKYKKEPFDIKSQLTKDYQDDINRSIIIPSEHKTQLLIELDAIGINKAFLFPELEHQAEYIKNKYMG